MRSMPGSPPREMWLERRKTSVEEPGLGARRATRTGRDREGALRAAEYPLVLAWTT